MGLVEQPQLGAAGDQRGDRRPAPLPGRQLGDHDAGEAAVESERGERGVGLGRGRPARPAQKRTLSATVRSSYSPVAWPSSPTRRRTAVRSARQRRSWPSTMASPETTGSEPGAGAQERGLAGAVRALEEHDLAPRRRRDRRRRERGTGRAARPRRGGGRPVRNGLHETTRGYWRPETPTKAGVNGSSVVTARTIAAVRLARVLGAIGRTMITARRAHPAVRRLPAVGHRHPRGAGAGPAAAPVRTEARRRVRRRRRGRRRRPTRRARRPRRLRRRRIQRRRPSRRPSRPSRRRRRRPRRARCSARSRSPRSASAPMWSKASGVDDLKKGPGHYPTRRCPDRRATPPSPVTAPPTARRSPTSTSSNPGDQITVTTLQGIVPLRRDRPGDRLPHRRRGARRQGRQPAHAHRLPPEVQRQQAHRRSTPSSRATPVAAAPSRPAAAGGAEAARRDRQRRVRAEAARHPLRRCCARHLGASPGWSASVGGSGRRT